MKAPIALTPDQQGRLVAMQAKREALLREAEAYHLGIITAITMLGGEGWTWDVRTAQIVPPKEPNDAT